MLEWIPALTLVVAFLQFGVLLSIERNLRDDLSGLAGQLETLRRHIGALTEVEHEEEEFGA